MKPIRRSIVRIGNSQGIRLPKSILQAAGLDGFVDITAKAGRIIITSDPHNSRVAEPAVLSQISLNNWSNPAEEAAWNNLR